MKGIQFKKPLLGWVKGSAVFLALGAFTAVGCAPEAYVPGNSSIPAENPRAAQAPERKTIEAMADSVANAQIESGVTPGMTVAIAKDGEVVFAKGYGKADVETGAAAGLETVYKIGSITKQFTAAIIMRLVEQGKVSLDDPIIKYLPDYPVQGHHLTLRHLLNHTSGIRNFTLQEENGRLFARDLSYREMVDKFGRRRFDFKPGRKHEYNNFAYYLLGEIIGRVTGTPYGEYVERELLQPLGLNGTMYCDESIVRPGQAKGYKREDGKLVSPRHVSMRSVGGAAALCSTAGDLTRWTSLLHSGKVVSAESLRQMITPTILSGGDTVGYGYGLFLGELDGHRKIYHGGRGVGFLSLVSHYPDDKLTVTVLMNSETDREKRDQVEKALARAALGVTVADLPLTGADIARYEGAYILQAGERTTELLVFGECGKLKAQIASGSVTQLRFQGDNTFVHGENDDIRLVFTVENGRAEGLKLQKGTQTMLGKRKP